MLLSTFSLGPEFLLLIFVLMNANLPSLLLSFFKDLPFDSKNWSQEVIA